MHLGRKFTYERLMSQFSQSVFYQILNAVNDDMLNSKKMFNGEIIFHFKKDTRKVVLLQVKGLIQITVKFRAEKNLRTFLVLSYTKHLFEGHEMSCTKTIV